MAGGPGGPNRGPFLTGPAQQASQDLTPEQASQYQTLKQAVLAYYGHSLAARAQRCHNCRFDPKGTVRSQIAQHARLIRRWFAREDGPSALDRVLLDNTIRQLPPDAQRTLATNHPKTLDKLIRQLENWQVARQLSNVVRTQPRPKETRRDRQGLEPPRRIAPPDRRPNRRKQVARLDTSLATARRTGRCPCLLTTCRVRQEAGGRPGHSGPQRHGECCHPPAA